MGHYCPGECPNPVPGEAHSWAMCDECRGRRLASQRDDLIAAGADPSELAIPLAPRRRPGIGWEVYEDDAVHVVPTQWTDAVAHVLDSECVCGPRVDFSGPRPLVIHHSLDGREARE